MKIDLEPHTSERLRQEHVEWADKIYTMTPERRCQITQLFPEASPKVELLDPRLPIEDPIGGGWKQYQILIERIEESLKQKLASLGSL